MAPTEPNAQHAEGFDDARRVADAFVEAYEDAAGGGEDPIEAGREAAQSADAAVTASR